MIPRVSSPFAQSTADGVGGPREALAHVNHSGTVTTGQARLHISTRACPIPSPCGGHVQSPSRDLRPFPGRGASDLKTMGTDCAGRAFLRHTHGACPRAALNRTETVKCPSRPSPLPLSPALALPPAKAPTLNAASSARASVLQRRRQPAGTWPQARLSVARLGSSATMSRPNSAATRSNSTGHAPASDQSPTAPGPDARGRFFHAVTCARAGQ